MQAAPLATGASIAPRARHAMAQKVHLLQDTAIAWYWVAVSVRKLLKVEAPLL
jgi:hypothetical protein